VTDDLAKAPQSWGTQIGGYEIRRELLAGLTALAAAPGDRAVVLKRLDADCLVQASTHPRLHPAIHDRLARVRELAHGQVANLHGVEHDQGCVYLVWEFLEGQTLEEWATGRNVSPRDLLLTARELILAVESLHARGIVHGAIHGRNVLVDAAGKLKLTHVSPLLYTDPQHDLEAVAKLFGELAARRGEAGSPLENLASEAQERDGTLRSMRTRAASLIDLRRDEASDAVEAEGDIRRRRRSRLGAVAAVLLGLVLSYGIKQYVSRLIPKPPAPPEAPPSALEP
jgi:hypothetical protein